MNIDLTAVRLFIDYLKNKEDINTVLNHDAYKTIINHWNYNNEEIDKKVIIKSLNMRKNNFYGFYHKELLFNKLYKIEKLIEIINENESKWIEIVKNIYFDFFSKDLLENIIIYPIIGYDIGIGFNGNVCLNIYNNLYIDNPTEILYWIIHESFHVLYVKFHYIKPLKKIENENEWVDLFKLYIQNEGFAVYFPLKIRKKNKHIYNKYHNSIKDYSIILDKNQIEVLIRDFFITFEKIKQEKLSKEEKINNLFCEKRFSYRIGCEIICRIENKYGISEVKNSIFLSPNDFFNKYIYLLK